ncbi:hypothetical protein Dimus_015383 [Dionaea muscipula]
MPQTMSVDDAVDRRKNVQVRIGGRNGVVALVHLAQWLMSKPNADHKLPGVQSLVV